MYTGLEYSGMYHGIIYALRWNILSLCMEVSIHWTGISHHFVWLYPCTRLLHSILFFTFGWNISPFCMELSIQYIVLEHSTTLYGSIYTLVYNSPSVYTLDRNFCSFCMVVSMHWAGLFCHFVW